MSTVATGDGQIAPRTIQNKFNGETFIFHGDGNDPSVARFDVVLGIGGSGGGNALVHVHPQSEERFIVQSGRLRVVVEGVAGHFGPGEVAVVPRGASHYFENDHDGETVATVEFRPAQQFVHFFANFPKLAEEHPTWFSPKGDPHLLLIAVTLQTYPDHLYLAGIPIWLQKWMFSLLAQIGRRCGYRVLIPPSPGR